MKKKFLGVIAILTIALTFVFSMNIKAANEIDNGDALAISEADCDTYCHYSDSYHCKLTHKITGETKTCKFMVPK